MDVVKEQLADAIGPSASVIADELGEAAVRQLISTAQELLSHGIDVIVEGFFQSDRYSKDFAELAQHADSLLIHLSADDSVLKHRYETRALAGDRHWIHGDIKKLPTLTPELPEHMAARLHLDIPTIVIDTSSHPLDIVSTLAFIRESTNAHLHGHPA